MRNSADHFRFTDIGIKKVITYNILGIRLKT